MFIFELACQCVSMGTWAAMESKKGMPLVRDLITVSMTSRKSSLLPILVIASFHLKGVGLCHLYGFFPTQRFHDGTLILLGILLASGSQFD